MRQNEGRKAGCNAGLIRLSPLVNSKRNSDTTNSARGRSASILKMSHTQQPNTQRHRTLAHRMNQSRSNAGCNAGCKSLSQVLVTCESDLRASV